MDEQRERDSSEHAEYGSDRILRGFAPTSSRKVSNEHHATSVSDAQKGPDPVYRPDHYTSGGIETWDFMKAKMSAEAFQGYLAGNVIKYITRYRMKNGLEDLQKAKQYLDKLVDDYEQRPIRFR